MKFRFLVSALMAAAAVAISCGPGEDEAGRGVGGQPAIEPASTGETSQKPPGAFESLLAHIPDNETTRESLLITDIASVRKYAGIELPGPNDDGQAVLEYISQVYLAGQNGPKTLIPRDEGWVTGFHNYVRDFSTYPYLGIDARNVDQIAVYEGSPAATVEIAAGRYARDSAQARLAECAECPPPSVMEHGGTSFWAWGGDVTGSLGDRLKPPAFDYVGRGGRIWIDEGLAVRTLRTADMREVIDASLDRDASLADDEGYVLAARALSGSGVTSAIFTATSFQVDDLFDRMKPMARADAFQTSEQTLRERLSESPLMRPFELVAVGTAFDGADPFTVVAIVHERPAEASANAEILRRRIEGSVKPLNAPGARASGEPPKTQPRYWRDEISRYDITYEGRVLVARLYGASATLLVPTNVMGGVLLAPLTVHE